MSTSSKHITTSLPTYGNAGIAPLADSPLLFAPAQPRTKEHLVEPGVLHGVAFLLAHIYYQAAKRSLHEWQAQHLGMDQHNRQYLAYSLALVDAVVVACTPRSQTSPHSAKRCSRRYIVLQTGVALLPVSASYANK